MIFHVVEARAPGQTSEEQAVENPASGGLHGFTQRRGISSQRERRKRSKARSTIADAVAPSRRA
jgi:hypothetical protein